MFFKILISYYLGMVASQMRASVIGLDKGTIPLNTYSINLSPSGTGKGYATSFIEREVLGQFKDIFMNVTFPRYAAMNLENIAMQRSIRDNTDPIEEFEALTKEFELVGPFLFNFDSATVPAIKQHRHKLQLAATGSLNFQVDEIGANLNNSLEVLHTFLELYDLGQVKDKLIKSTSENKRMESVKGSTPANMLLFGTPTKLLDGGKTEQDFFDLLEMGYARRCLFSFSKDSTKKSQITAAEIVRNMRNTKNSDYVEELSQHFAILANENNLNKNIVLEEEMLIKLIEYRLLCELKASKFAEQDTIKKAEMDHRYFKVLKLAGVYAFIDGEAVITDDHLEYAISLVEASGQEFSRLMIPELPHMKLAKFLAEAKVDMTLSELTIRLPYFKGSKPMKEDMINLAVSYGYRNNIVIKRFTENGVPFLRGESLDATNLDELMITISHSMAHNYIVELSPFKDLAELGQVDGINWCNHQFLKNHRADNNVIAGFNLIVLDVDDGFPIKAAIKAFEGTKAMFYTTKRSKPNSNRYRILIPTNYILHLDHDDYKEFLNNVIAELPFEVDTASNQRSKKWLTHNGEVYFTEGETFDVLPYIPNTYKSVMRHEDLAEGDFDRIEAWVVNNSAYGNRNNQLYNYACILLDAGHDFQTIEEKVLSLNSKFDDGLPVDELNQTVLRSIAKKLP